MVFAAVAPATVLMLTLHAGGVHSLQPFGISPAAPQELLEAASFAVCATWEEPGEAELSVAQRMLLTQSAEAQLMERFRRPGRYAAPIHDRRLPAELLLARCDNGELVGMAGIEGSVVDVERKLVLRRSAGERAIREALNSGACDGGSDGDGEASFGRRFYRERTSEEYADMAADLTSQTGSDETRAVVLRELADELATATLPPELVLQPVISALAVAPSWRREGLARNLCCHLEDLCARWHLPGGRPPIAMVEEDNLDAAALLRSLGYAQSWVDPGHVAKRPERPSPKLFNRRELEILKVPMPLLAFEKCDSY